MIRVLAAVLAVALMLTACSGAAESAPSTTTLPPTTTTRPTTTIPETTIPETTVPFRPPSGIAERLSAGDSRYPGLGNGGYDADHYTIDLSVAEDTGEITALVDMTAIATEDLDVFSLDFVGYDVTDLTVDGAPADFTRQEGKLIITSPDRIQTGSEFTASIAYAGRPDPVQSAAVPFQVGWRTAPDGVTYVASEPDGARSWMPVNDHPSDKATYTFHITVPDPLLAAANGVLVSEVTDLGFATWTWEMTQPMASYLATVVVGPLEIVTAGATAAGAAIRNVLPTDLVSDPPVALGRQAEMIDYFSRIFGPYPFDTYGIAVVDGFESALEDQTLSIFGRWIVDTPGFLETALVHELAHQWFGDSVTPADWGDVWLNEGFATYAEWLWIEHTKGSAAYDTTVTRERAQLAGASVPPPGNPPAGDLFNTGVYTWGGLVLAALRSTVGDTAFFSILSRYYEAHAGSTATTATFIAVAEDVSGMDLGDFFATWLNGESVPPLPS